MESAVYSDYKNNQRSYLMLLVFISIKYIFCWVFYIFFKSFVDVISHIKKNPATVFVRVVYKNLLLTHFKLTFHFCNLWKPQIHQVLFPKISVCVEIISFSKSNFFILECMFRITTINFARWFKGRWLRRNPT